MSTVVVRLARAEDRDLVWPLARELATSYVVEPEAYAATFTALLSAPDALLLVAEDDQRVVGYLLGYRHRTFHANAPVLWVEEVMVDPGRRGRGVGRALMHAAESWGREVGAVCRPGDATGRSLLRHSRLSGVGDLLHA